MVHFRLLNADLRIEEMAEKVFARDRILVRLKGYEIHTTAKVCIFLILSAHTVSRAVS